MATAMQKYEACACLVEIKERITGEIEYAMEAVEKASEKDEQEGVNEYRQKQIAKMNRWLQALDMAGKSLTR